MTLWRIKIHRLVVEEDLKNINDHDRTVIFRTIHKKLSIAPEKYGAPLQGGLKDYWKLKISHFRVIYRIEREIVQVLVLKLGMRRDEAVYREMLARIRKL